MPISPERLAHYLRLHLADGVGPIMFKRLIERFGDVAAAATAHASNLRQVNGIGDKTAAAIEAVTDQAVREELDLAAAAGATIITLEDDAYPAGLKNIHDPPPVLYVQGRIEPSDAVAIGVVGSRRCTMYGLEQAGRFGGLLGRAGFAVISGGARGIDAAAHRGCLDAGGRTIAVMGCGLGRLYPPENAELFRRIVAEGRGAIVSELPMRTAVLAGNFPTRNRIICGLSLGLLVVEAARRSGSLISARLAVEQGKEVFALPGRVDSPFSEDTNEMIRDHSAALVSNLEDILDNLEQVGREMKKSGAIEATAVPAPKVELTELERLLLTHLSGNELSLDDLVRRAACPAPAVTAAMTMLAIKGMVTQKPGGIFAARRAAT